MPLDSVATVPIAPPLDDPEALDWLQHQTDLVIAVGEPDQAADLVVATEQEAALMRARAESAPEVVLEMRQLLRQPLNIPKGLEAESLAYARLQDGALFRRWLAQRDPPEAVIVTDSDAIVMERKDDHIVATLNRPAQHNSMTMAMREAWNDLLDVVLLDSTVQSLSLRARGRCFSTGGELREFGLSNNSQEAHTIRMQRSPAMKLAGVKVRVNCQVHGACIGSGIELAAFAQHLGAARHSFFQLPELRMGLIPGSGGTVSIRRRIGRQRLLHWFLSGRRISASTALSWGLVDTLLEAEDRDS